MNTNALAGHWKDENYNDQRPASNELSVLDYSTKAECNRMMRQEFSHLPADQIEAKMHELIAPKDKLVTDSFTNTDPPPPIAGGDHKKIQTNHTTSTAIPMIEEQSLSLLENLVKVLILRTP